MDGILIIDKPAGITSHDVVARVRRALKTKRVGHTGTLDPFATGVMVLLVGKATRLAQFLDKDEKGYEAVIRFGFETDTGDITGVPAEECMPNEQLAGALDSIDWESALAAFRGTIEQTPPMFSAKKIDGKKLYELARRGESVQRKALPVVIRELELLASSAPFTRRVRVVCSAGTYIRTLAEDIGRAVGTGAHLTELRRTRAGDFAIEDAVSIDELASSDDPHAFLRPVRDAVTHLRAFELREERVERTRNGMSTRDLSGQFFDGESVQMIDAAGELIAVGTYVDAEKVVQPKVVLG